MGEQNIVLHYLKYQTLKNVNYFSHRSKTSKRLYDNIEVGNVVRFYAI